MTEPDRLEVMQADRDAAVELMLTIYGDRMFGDFERRESIRAGENDQFFMVQAFARHRIETNSRTGDTVEGSGACPTGTAALVNRAQEVSALPGFDPLAGRLRLHTTWRDSHGELNNAPNEAAAAIEKLVSTLVSVRKVLAGIEGHPGGDGDDRNGAFVAGKLIDVVLAK